MGVGAILASTTLLFGCNAGPVVKQDSKPVLAIRTEPEAGKVSIHWDTIDTHAITNLGSTPSLAQSVKIVGHFEVPMNSTSRVVGMMEHPVVTSCVLVDDADKPVINPLLDRVSKAFGPVDESGVGLEHPPMMMLGSLTWNSGAVTMEPSIEFPLDSFTNRPEKIRSLRGFVVIARAARVWPVELIVAEAGRRVKISDATSVWLELPKSTTAPYGSLDRMYRLWVQGKLDGLDINKCPRVPQLGPGFISINGYDEQGAGTPLWLRIESDGIFLDLYNSRKIVLEVFSELTIEKIPFEIRNMRVP